MYPYNTNPDDFQPVFGPNSVNPGDRVSAAWANTISQRLQFHSFQDLFREFGVQVREGKIVDVYDGRIIDDQNQNNPLPIELPHLKVFLYDESALDTNVLPQRSYAEQDYPIIAFPAMQARDRLAIPVNGNYDGRLVSEFQYRAYLSELYVTGSEVILYHFEGAYYFPIDEFPVIEAEIIQHMGGDEYQLKSLLTNGKLLARNVQGDTNIPNGEKVIVYLRKPQNFFDWFRGEGSDLKTQNSTQTVIVNPTKTLTFDADAFVLTNPNPDEAYVHTNLKTIVGIDTQTQVCNLEFEAGPGINITLDNTVPLWAKVIISALGGGGGAGHHATYLFNFPGGPTAFMPVDTYDFRDKIFHITACHFTRIPELPFFPDPYIVDDQVFSPFTPGQTFTKGESWNYWSGPLTDAGGPPQNIAANLFGAPAYWRLQPGTGALMMKYNVTYPGYIAFTVHAS